MGKEQIIIPKTLEECYIELDNTDDTDGLKEWLAEDEDSAITTSHHALGRWIRNNWDLWKGGDLKDWFIKHEIKHPDDMSGIILRSYHRYKNGVDIDLEKQINKSVEYYLSEKQILVRRRRKKLKKLQKIKKLR